MGIFFSDERNARFLKVNDGSGIWALSSRNEPFLRREWGDGCMGEKGGFVLVLKFEILGDLVGFEIEFEDFVDIFEGEEKVFDAGFFA